MKLFPGQRLGRVALKRFLYSQLYQRDAFRLMFGAAKPLLPFKVEADPPSVYFNFEIDPKRVSKLRRELDLPYPLTKIRCLEDDDPFYCMTLNTYRVSGLAYGIRAEWSVYIKDDGGTPRYLVLEAQSDTPSLDGVNLITMSGEVTQVGDAKSIETTAVAADGGRFTARCRNPGSGPLVRAAPEWIEANDYIYWMNGICDRTFYDSGLANPKMRLIRPRNVRIEDTTRWGDMVLSKPRSVVAFENAIDFAISPWWNLDETAPSE